MRSRLRASLALTLVAVSLVSGCGGGGDETTTSASSPSEWADGVCGAAATWKDSITSVASDLKQGNLSKSDLQSSANTIKDSTQTLVDDLETLGKPTDPAAQQAKADVDQLSTDLTGSVNKVKSSVANASGIQGVLSAVSVVSGQLVAMSDSLSSTVTKLKSLPTGSLQQAFEDSSACTDLTGS